MGEVFRGNACVLTPVGQIEVPVAVKAGIPRIKRAIVPDRFRTEYELLLRTSQSCPHVCQVHGSTRHVTLGFVLVMHLYSHSLDKEIHQSTATDARKTAVASVSSSSISPSARIDAHEMFAAIAAATPPGGVSLAGSVSLAGGVSLAGSRVASVEPAQRGLSIIRIFHVCQALAEASKCTAICHCYRATVLFCASHVQSVARSPLSEFCQVFVGSTVLLLSPPGLCGFAFKEDYLPRPQAPEYPSRCVP